MRIGEIIRGWRSSSKIGLREASAQIGISHATLSRIERGGEPSARAILAIFDWMTTARIPW